MNVRSDRLTKYVSARSLGAEGAILLDANEAQTGSELRSYGIQQNRELLGLLARNYQVGDATVLYDRGLDEIISLILRATCDAGSRVRIFTPTYGMYAVEAEAQGVAVERVALRPDGRLDLEEISQNPGTPSLVILCRPNNPLGTVDSVSSVIELLETYRGICPVFIDEAYAEFTPDTALDYRKLIEEYDVVFGRTFSKAYGLAGLRFGCALAAPRWISRLSVVQRPYPVSRLVESFILSHFESTIRPSAERNIESMLDARPRWQKALSDLLVLTPLPSHANFLCFQTLQAQKIYARFRSGGVVVRFFEPDLLRITVGTDTQLNRIEELLGSPL